MRWSSGFLPSLVLRVRLTASADRVAIALSSFSPSHPLEARRAAVARFI